MPTLQGDWITLIVAISPKRLETPIKSSRGDLVLDGEIHTSIEGITRCGWMVV